jgi:hypothetical protein
VPSESSLPTDPRSAFEHRLVVYSLVVDNVLRPLVSRLKGLHQSPVRGFVRDTWKGCNSKRRPEKYAFSANVLAQ